MRGAIPAPLNNLYKIVLFMNIISVLPHAAGTYTEIFAQREGKPAKCYAYMHNIQLLQNPDRYGEFMGWNGGTLTEAILFLIELN